MFSWGDWRPWNQLALIGIVVGGTACGNSGGASEASDPAMFGTMGMIVTPEGAVNLWASYHREVEGCPETTLPLGDCEILRDCTSSPPPEFFDAGEVTIAGTALTYASSYFGALSGSVPYGQSIIAEGSGSDDVPTHSLSLTVPEPASVVEPSSDEVVIDRTRDLVVRWQGGSDGTLSALLFTSNTRVVCVAALDAGSITFPKALLAELEPTLADSPGGLTVTHLNSTFTTQGQWEFAFYASLALVTRVAVVE